MTSPEPCAAPIADAAPDEPGEFSALMASGVAAHGAGDRVKALVAFESARTLAPDNAHAVSACATLLFELSRPRAAFKLLLGVEKLLLADPDGATNLAIAASACGQLRLARAYFEHALTLDADHAPALTQLGLMAAREGRWADAIGHATGCLSLAPANQDAWIYLADFLMGAQRHTDALAHLHKALHHFPEHPQIAMRRAVALALAADFEAADQALAALNPEATTALQHFLHGGTAAQSAHAPAIEPDARELFSRQAFDAMEECDWRDQERLTAALREQIATGRSSGHGRDLRLALLFGLALPLSEDEMTQAVQATWTALARPLEKPQPPFSGKRSLRRDERIHIGISAHSLRDLTATAALTAQLACHDHARFVFHVYSPTPQPQEVLAEPLLPHQVVEIAHFTDEEAVRRIRLDPLDLWMDLGFSTPSWRPGIAQRRVAPVQLQQLSWQRRLPRGPYDYNLSDTFIHPDAEDSVGQCAAQVRLPHTCWLAAYGQTPAAPALTRKDAGLPAGALVLCALVPPLRIDPQTFKTWMALLLALPDAVLWLPAYTPAAQANLARVAQGAGVAARQLVFAGGATGCDTLALMPLGDLFLDPLRFNANQSLTDALQMGLPAISCAGNSMASRLGGSILRAAGLPQCVVQDHASYSATVVALGRDRSQLADLRRRLQEAKATAPLFDLQARVKELEAAWTFMAGRAHAGLPPEAFDVPGSRR